MSNNNNNNNNNNNDDDDDDDDDDNTVPLKGKLTVTCKSRNLTRFSILKHLEN